MNANNYAKKIILDFDCNYWDKRKLNSNSFSLVPKNMLEAFSERNPETLREKGLPYIYVIESSEGNITVEASAGVIRAMPIFFSLLGDGTFVLCDNPLKINSLSHKNQLPGLSILEYLSFGYVTGSRTLLVDVNQLQAGESLTLKDGKLKVRNEYVYDVLPLESKTYEEFVEELKVVTEKVFSSLIKNLDGRIPVVPLSGGYDSRFIVSMLKLAGVKDVICLSYSIPGNFESKISKAVAEKLGYEWHYIEYGKKKWINTFSIDEFNSYLRFAHNFTSISCFQEYLSTKFFDTQIKQEGKSNYIFIPGHAADFVAGSHLNALVLAAKSREDIVDSILAKHYNLRAQPINDIIKHEVKERVSKDSEVTSELFRLYEIWNWRERQSKFIANANRIYEYFGYSWSMPFWNKEFIDFWSKVPLKLKYKKKLYDEYLENNIFNKLGIDFDRKEREAKRAAELKTAFAMNTTIKQKIKGIAKKHKMMVNFYRSFRKLFKSQLNPCAFDTANPYLLKIAAKKYPSGYLELQRMLKENFPNGRGGDPNSYVADYIMSSILEKYGDNIIWD
ncbi:MAG: hypothetical protein J7L34_06480 [Thermotogaceae bacterium]|nr:hypothetical protein [Thermotogaceae bacterium]